MKQTQTSKVVAALKGRWLTYGDMAKAAGTLNAHRRALEWLDRQSAWKLKKAKSDSGLVLWRLYRA